MSHQPDHDEIVEVMEQLERQFEQLPPEFETPLAAAEIAFVDTLSDRMGRTQALTWLAQHNYRDLL